VAFIFNEKFSDILVRYSHFNGSLFHDPSLGFHETGSGWWIVAIIVGCILVLGIGLGGLIIYSRKKRSEYVAIYS
jgi:hypothetical protein